MLLNKSFPHGRSGNALFQYAFIRALSQRNRVEWALPLWGGSQYFSMKWNEDIGYQPDISIKETDFNFNKGLLLVKDKTKNIDYFGYFQSLSYFADVWNDIKEDFKFERSFLKQTLKKAELKFYDNHVAVHVRRGDYVDKSNLYVNLPIDYYTSYFIKNPNLVFHIFTDDYAYCRLNFEQFPNVVFVDGYSDIEHLCLMSQFKRHFMANSSFSWWGCKLAELYNDNVHVIRPDALFTGAYSNKSNGVDFYPPYWEKREVFKIIPKQEKKTDFTVVIPIKYDHQDREENLTLVLNYLIKHFNPKIIVGEQGGDHFKYVEKSGVRYMNFPYPYFHRTKMINEMIKASTTEVIFNWDADVLIPPGQVEETLLQLKNYDVVFPYDGRFVKVNRSAYPNLMKTLDVSGLKVDPNEPYNSKGGCVAFNRPAFKRIGMYNEHFLSHAPEDSCLYYRMNCLGTVKRVKGPLFHIDHFVGPDSTHNNEFRVINTSENRKVTTASYQELKKYIETWHWCK